MLSPLIHKDWLRLGIGPCTDATHESTASWRMSSECLPRRVAVSKKEVQHQGNGQSSQFVPRVAPQCLLSSKIPVFLHCPRSDEPSRSNPVSAGLGCQRRGSGLSTLSASSWWPELDGAASPPPEEVRGGMLWRCRRSSSALAESRPRSTPAVPPFAGDEEISCGRLSGHLLLGAGGLAARGVGAGLIKCFGRERNLPRRRGAAISASAIKEKFSSAFSFFFLIIIFSKPKVLSGNLKACGRAKGGRGARQGKRPKHGGIPSTPRGASPQLLPPVRPPPARHFWGKVDTTERPESSSCCAAWAGSETAVAGEKRELFCLFK